MPDVMGASGPTTSSHFQAFFKLEVRGDNIVEAVYSAPIVVRNNTVVNLQSEENATKELELVQNEDAENLSDITTYDNIVIGANVPNAAELPDWSPVNATTYRPETGSAAIEGATGVSPYRDLKATVRPASASVGALEPEE
jgi:hypothetical protein